MDRHDVKLVEHLTAVGTLSHPVRDSVVDTTSTENMPACFQDSILEVVMANGASGKFAKHLFLFGRTIQGLCLPLVTIFGYVLESDLQLFVLGFEGSCALS